ncbi:glycosyltransferase family 4 protein [Sulfurovum sp. TSL1]|uniref:glycosyltransferase family 4 protein n=1 Tax=Sulfurovum sp. TSL1 TaxID=2826994 RepID=UPI001CC646D9|nr:glycosyltransferase family 4 protein [Sulfurovum sp. TSL1]GIT98134.1 glycoside hydrolase [Sulfurovum sp. TSL1]
MNICLVCNEYPPYKCGGIGTFTYELATSLRKSGHRVIVVGIYPDIEEDKEIEGVRVVRLKSWGGKTAFFTNSTRLGYQIKSLIKEEDLDIVESVDFEGVSAFWPKLTIPVIIRLHGSVTYFAKEMGTRVSKLTFLIEKRALQKSDYICSVSDYTAQKTKKIFNLDKNITTIYNGVKIPDENRCKKEFTKNYLVSFSGSLMRKKGVLSLAKAWNMVKEKRPEAKLRFIGKDTFEDGISIKEKIYSLVDKQYHDLLEFTGHVSKESMEAMLVESDVAIYPSYAEAFSLAPLEAMALKLPTIYSNRTSGEELKKVAHHLEIIDPDNIIDVAEKILSLLDSNDTEYIGIENRKDIVKYFNIEEKLKENIKYYKSCINEFK